MHRARWAGTPFQFPFCTVRHTASLSTDARSTIIVDRDGAASHIIKALIEQQVSLLKPFGTLSPVPADHALRFWGLHRSIGQKTERAPSLKQSHKEGNRVSVSALSAHSRCVGLEHGSFYIVILTEPQHPFSARYPRLTIGRTTPSNMPWPFSSSGSSTGEERNQKGDDRPKDSTSWNELLPKPRRPFEALTGWTPILLAAAGSVGSFILFQNYLKRFPGAANVQENFFRRRTLFGRVTSVGDGDGFHLYHTPGGKLAGWGWLRKIPQARAGLKGNTVSGEILMSIKTA